MLLSSFLSGQFDIFAFFTILVALIIAITIHEFAHAWVALRLGDPTAKLEGRISLNPLVHLDTMGTILLLTVGFGWGKPVPINPNYFHKKNDDLKVSLAGVTTNLVFAFVAALPIRFALLSGYSIEHSIFLTVLDVIVQINIMLAVFNLLPIPPLDGSHVLAHFLTDEQREVYASVGPSLLVGLVLLDFVTHISIFSIVLDPAITFLVFLATGR